MTSLASTQLLYLENSLQFDANGTILTVQDQEDGKKAVILDQTIFYPQGGGQPCDLGIIETESGVFEVTSVYFDAEIVYHVGNFRSGRFDSDQPAKISINSERRLQLSKIHTAGHLLDVAMLNLDLKLPPTKGYHYPDSPYVEYLGIIPAEDRAEVKQKLESELKRLIQEGFEVKAQSATRDQLADLCYFVPAWLPEDKPIRVVTVYGKLACPCGGTHVKNINELGSVKIKKIKAKSGKTRITYQL